MACKDDYQLVRISLNWVDKMVIGHNLCPFAASVRGAIRTVVCHGSVMDVREVLKRELERLLTVSPEQKATTLLLLVGDVFCQFDKLMEFVPEAQDLADALALPSQLIQVLPFHPEASYSEQGRDASDFSTRSPFPMLHLLRDSDIVEAERTWAERYAGEPPSIQERNAAYLRGLGWEHFNELASDANQRPSDWSTRSGTV
eukprot:CAMPEP_0119318930 /NCGR_PEP_ID=MMETSP1333-20130426/48027_1 /TAXON_ID=418940 /ORGANISM="Scyphosphaera apsteinii, Strain RCC1455" /LENGTH=200 /DNA_ID=CAMNT_0007325243 /DNA_START=358 /DNA_END=960 /DNA_ORIENTATION=-